MKTCRFAHEEPELWLFAEGHQNSVHWKTPSFEGSQSSKKMWKMRGEWQFSISEHWRGAASLLSNILFHPENSTFTLHYQSLTSRCKFPLLEHKPKRERKAREREARPHSIWVSRAGRDSHPHTLPNKLQAWVGPLRPQRHVVRKSWPAAPCLQDLTALKSPPLSANKKNPYKHLTKI